MPWAEGVSILVLVFSGFAGVLLLVGLAGGPGVGGDCLGHIGQRTEPLIKSSALAMRGKLPKDGGGSIQGMFLALL
jgi:hypothetical protein